MIDDMYIETEQRETNYFRGLHVDTTNLSHNRLSPML